MRYAVAHSGRIQHYAQAATPSEAMDAAFAAHGMTRSHAHRPIRLDASPSWLVYAVGDDADGPDAPEAPPLAGFTVTEIF